MPMAKTALLVLAALAYANGSSQTVSFQRRNVTEERYGFEVDYENDRFLLDGRPFRYVSGSFHYFRAPKQYWSDRLRKMRAAGLNAVSTYVEWSLHQPEPNVWNWSGDADLLEFLNIAQAEGMYVLLRPGPYICAERDMGGLPYWLLSLEPNAKLRTNDERYMKYVEIYLNTLLDKIEPYLRGNGGPIIMVQVENEYGSFYACNTAYKNRLSSIMREKIGRKALLYTTDGFSFDMLRCGKIANTYTTIDFGTGVNVTQMFAIMRRFQPRGPLVNSEFYPGWLTHWEEPYQRVKSSAVKETLDQMLEMGASVNFYMFYGGTNFGFTSGANGGRDQYSPQITSYDYDAPLTEAGDPWEKYFDIRDIVKKYLPLSNVSLPVVSPKGNYGAVLLEPIMGLLDPEGKEIFGTSPVRADKPLTFEALRVPTGLVLYETQLPTISLDPAILSMVLRDRALIYLENNLIGTLSRMKKIFTMPIRQASKQRLQILVENQGRLNYGNLIEDFKGIWNVTINNASLIKWNMTGFKLDSVAALDNATAINKTSGFLKNGPLFLKGEFTVPGQPLDTYLDTTSWGKGVAYVNGHNLGRYWPVVGPQVTLYVPGSYLKTGRNSLVIMELEYVPQTKKIKFQDTPNFGIRNKT